MTVHIRLMTTADKPAIMNLLHNTPEFLPDEVVVAEEVIDAYLYDPSGSGYYTIVAEADSVVAGYASFGPTPLTEGTWDLYWIAVDHKSQGKGIGASLMQFVEKKIIGEKGRLILIETSSKPEYNKTRRFYANLEYEEICQIPDFYAPGDNLVMLLKRLS